MKLHEASCTLNPKRDCRMCTVAQREMGDHVQAQMSDLIAALQRDHARHDAETANETLDVQLSPFEPKELREAAGNCPACMLAAIRQTNSYPVKFEFSDEKTSFWKDVNDARDDY